MAKFVVPMRFVVTGLAYVEADNAEQARAFADSTNETLADDPDIGKVEYDFEAGVGELLDWHSTGPAVSNG